MQHAPCRVFNAALCAMRRRALCVQRSECKPLQALVQHVRTSSREAVSLLVQEVGEGFLKSMRM